MGKMSAFRRQFRDVLARCMLDDLHFLAEARRQHGRVLAHASMRSCRTGGKWS